MLDGNMQQGDLMQDRPSTLHFACDCAYLHTRPPVPYVALRLRHKGCITATEGWPIFTLMLLLNLTAALQIFPEPVHFMDMSSLTDVRCGLLHSNSQGHLLIPRLYN